MRISELVEILNDIGNNFGDLRVEIHYDPRQSESLIKDPEGINIDDVKTLQISEDNTVVYIQNRYSWINDYNGCKGEVYYNPETKLYEGRIIPDIKVDGFDTTFSSPDKYKIEEIFKNVVDEYNNFLGNNKISETMNVVNNILDKSNNENSSEEVEEYESSDDDEDYGEV